MEGCFRNKKYVKGGYYGVLGFASEVSAFSKK